MLSTAGPLIRAVCTGCTRCFLLALPALFACDTVGVKDAYTALDGQGQRKRDVFYTDTEAIYCVLEMASGVDDFTVLAKLRSKRIFDESTGKPRELDSIVAVEELAPGAGEDLTLSFHVEVPEGSVAYPAGEFRCEFYLDGRREVELDFEIRYPDCPSQPIVADEACAGIVLRGSECPGAWGVDCVCSEDSGAWDCE